MSMRLSALLRDVITIPATLDREVHALALDSKTVTPGAAFIALRGAQRHGIEFSAEAVARGASIVLAEAPLPDITLLDVPVLAIERLRERLGALARRFHDDAAGALRLIGVTGTNGKTSSVQMIAQALSAAGEPCGTIGTLGTGLYGHITAGERTTPDVLAVHASIAAMRSEGARSIAMEVTSHALAQGRVDGLDFEIAVFTNLTRDHLDYHGTMAAYGATKAQLFAWPSLRVAVINIDDAFGAELADRMRAGVRVIRTGCSRQDVEVHASDVHADASGLRFTLWIEAARLAVASKLIGRFNVANLLGVAGVLHACGWPAPRIAASLAALDPVPGRMSRLGGDGLKPLVVVDYAHTPGRTRQGFVDVARPRCGAPDRGVRLRRRTRCRQAPADGGTRRAEGRCGDRHRRQSAPRKWRCHRRRHPQGIRPARGGAIRARSRQGDRASPSPWRPPTMSS